MKFIKNILRRIKGEQSLDKLKKRGLVVGSNFKMMGGCIIDPSHCWHIQIGNNVTLAPRVHIIAHDTSTKTFLNYTRVANIKIGDRVFIGAGTIILPGVTIGNDVIIGAGSIVTKNIPSDSLVVGVPATVISSLENYIEKEKNKMNSTNCFSSEYTLRNEKFSSMHRKELLNGCEQYGHIFVE